MNKHGTYTEQEARYITVPLPMLRLLLREDKKQAIQEIVAYGFYLSAMNQCATMENAILQLLYLYIHDISIKNGFKWNIPKSLYNELVKLDKQVGLSDDDWGGFTTNGKEFNPIACNGKSSVDVVLDYCKANPNFGQNAQEFHAIRQLCSLFNYNYVNYDVIINVHEKYKEYDNWKPYASMNINILREYLENIDEMDSDDFVTLMWYASAKAKIGLSGGVVARTYKDEIIEFMLGCRSEKELSDLLDKNAEAMSFYNKYSKPDIFGRIRSNVKDRKFIPIIFTVPGKPRSGTFISTRTDLTPNVIIEGAYDIIEEDKKRMSRKTTAKYREKKKLKKEDDFYSALLNFCEKKKHETKTDDS